MNCEAYEVWRHRQLFLLNLSAGAPPDALFLGGQNWGLPPVDPHALRAIGLRLERTRLLDEVSAAVAVDR